MGRAQPSIETPSKRARLKARKNPYWVALGGGRGGVSLGYRRGSSGAGSWIGKLVFEGKRAEERLGDADDDGAPAGAISYRSAVAAALEWSKRRHFHFVEGDTGLARGDSLTVRAAVEHYVKDRRRQSTSADRFLGSRLGKHVLKDAEFSSLELSKLREHHFDSWRDRLPIRADAESEATKGTISRSTYNRLANDLRAALNAAARRHRRELPAQVLGEITAGTKALATSETARKQILSDAQVSAIVRSAFDPSVDADGDFGRLVALLAATGARFRQVAAIEVADFQLDKRRVLVPPSNKGRSRKPKPPAAVPIDDAVIDLLRPAIDGRAATSPLLERWAYRRGHRLDWVKDHRERWTNAHQIDRLWAKTVALANVPEGTIPYSLRHSSIVRSLRAGVPLRIVAANHDTSVAMLERHYSRFISEASDDISRLGALTL